jgi:hypothetical protein
MRRQTDTAYNDDAWHQVVATYDGSNTRNGMKIYIDGVLATMEDADDSSLSGNISNNVDFEIGGRDGGSQAFNGSIDDVRLYGRALSLNEVKSIYESSQ